MPKTNLIFALALLLAAVSCREYDVLPDVEIAQDVWDADSVLEMLQQPEKEVEVATGATSTAKCNWQCYLNRYPDLQRAFGKHNTKAAAAHWKAHGKKEGRKCTCRARSGWKYCAGENKQCSFRGKAVVKFGAKGKWSRRTKVNGTRCANNVFGDPIPGTVKKCYYKLIHHKKKKPKKKACNWQCYLNRYPDLQRAFGKHNTKAAAAHWKAHGKKEGRKCTCRARSGHKKKPKKKACNWQCYLNRYPDLQRAFGKHNTKAAAAHWKAHGKKEGRKCMCPKKKKPSCKCNGKMNAIPAFLLTSTPSKMLLQQPDEEVEVATGGWKYCAGENKQCSFRGKAVVKFGAKGKWSRRTKVNGTRCANNVFGDPIPGTVKKCYYKRIHMKKLAGRPCIYGSSNMWCSVAKSCVKASGVIHYAQQGRHCVPFCLTNRFKNAKWKHC